MTTFHKRMKRGLRWHDHNAPKPTAAQIASAVFAALIVTLCWLYAAYSDAHAGMLEAQSKQIKTEVALVTLLNGDPVILDKESGMVALARVETYGEPK